MLLALAISVIDLTDDACLLPSEVLVSGFSWVLCS